MGIVDNGKMFNDEQGFIDAMNGVYASMTFGELYGENLSFGLIDEIAQLYYNDRQHYETVLNKTIDLKYMDIDVRRRIDGIWKSAYNVISSANSILDNAETRSYPSIERIRGEAMAVRAFIHFDMLRLFAPSYGNPSAKAIPYVTHFSNDPVAYSSVEEVYGYIKDDLEKALEALKSSPSVPRRKNKALYINYHSAAAVLASVHNWAGNHKEAGKYALIALEGGYKLNREENIKNLFQGYIAKEECLWGLHAPKMYLNVRKRLMSSLLSDDTDMVRQGFRELYAVSSFTPSNNDYRYQSYFTIGKWGSGTVAFSKLYDKYYDENQTASGSRTPGINLIRLPELYYILSESEYEANKIKSLAYLNEVVTSRGLSPIKLEDIQERKNYEKILVDEIIKEFWGEGRAFFAYKRFWTDMKGVDGKIHYASDNVYILPVPEEEKEDGI